MSDRIFKRAATSTSLGLAVIAFTSGSAPQSAVTLDWKPITSNELVYSTAMSPTYWSGTDKRLKLRKIIKRFNFIKSGRGKPTSNHEHFLSIWS